MTGSSCLGRNIITGAVESGVDGAVSGGLSYLTGPGPHTVGGFAAATAGGGGFGGVMGGAGGALSKATGVSRYGCFTADTPVLMADGTTKPIGQVAVGERVVSHDPITGEDVEAEVEATHVHHDVPTLEVTTTAGTITTTSTHPFYVQGRGWTPAADLRRGDRLKTPHTTTNPDPDNRTAGDGTTTGTGDAGPTGDGQAVAVLTIQPTGRTTTVHNLTVRNTHNYHVLTTPTTNTTGPDTDRTNTRTAPTPILVHNNGSCDDGLDDLASMRTDLGLPSPGPKKPTLSRLDVEGQIPVYGISAHGQDVTLRVNPISRTHAETDVFQQVANRGGAGGADAVLYVDHPDGLCNPCGRYGAVRSMARQVGINNLTVVWPNGRMQI